jgi:hypothetical protein
MRNVKPLAAPLAVLALALALAPPSAAQTPPPALGTPAPRPWKPLIIVDPRPYLSPSPAPARKRTPKHRATPHPRSVLPGRRRPLPAPTPETFERLDTSPSPRP